MACSSNAASGGLPKLCRASVTICHNMSQYVTICHNMSQYVTICHNMSQYVTIASVKDGQRWSKGRLSGSEETGRLTITSRKVVGIGPQRSLDLAGREIGMWMQRGDSIILIESYPTMSIRYVQTTEFTPAMSMAATKNKAKIITVPHLNKGTGTKNCSKIKRFYLVYVHLPTLSRILYYVFILLYFIHYVICHFTVVLLHVILKCELLDRSLPFFLHHWECQELFSKMFICAAQTRCSWP